MSISEKAKRHIRMRWVGAPLFFFGLLLLFFSFLEVKRGGGGHVIVFGLMSTLMGLTVFGINHDTALQLALEARRENEDVKLDDELHLELERELRRDKAATLALDGNPRLALILPVVVLLVQIFTGYLLFGK